MKFESIFPNHFSVQHAKVDDIIRSYWIIITGEYKINIDKSIDIFGDVKFSDVSSFIKELPLKFNRVSGNFDCSRLSLSSLKNSPIEVGGIFDCSHNPLKSLEFAPVKADIFIFDNNIKSLSTDNVNCTYNKVVMLILNSNPTLGIPNNLIQNTSLSIFIKYQNYFEVWNADKTLNEKGFNSLIEEIEDGLQ